MNILVGNNQLERTGGSENYTYALATTLKAMGHNVEYFTFHKGMVTDQLEAQGIHEMSHNHYDLILANHTPVIERLFTYGYTIQTCHGTIMGLEQPSPYADSYVSVTEEVQEHLEKSGIKSEVILNGIDCKRFRPTRQLPEKLGRVLSLCQSEKMNAFLKDSCDSIGVKLTTCNKFTDNVWEIENAINEADLVIGIGRSLYDAMACGRCVISYDWRDYMNSAIGDGYITKENIEEDLKHNCSGRSLKKTFSKEEFIAELQKYDPKDGAWARQFALQHLNMEKSAKRYIDIYEEEKNKGGDIDRAKLSHLHDMLFKHIEENRKAIEETKTLTQEKNKRLRETTDNLQKQIDETNKNISNLYENISNLYENIERLNVELQRANSKNRKHLRIIRITAYAASAAAILIIALHLFVF